MQKKTLPDLIVENWNLKHRVGTPVNLRKDNGDIFKTYTTAEAFVSNSGHAVCYFEGVSGFYMLDRATPVDGN